VTRRGWRRCLVKVGSTQSLRTSFSKEDEFAKAEILSIRQEKLRDMTKEDAQKEGFSDLTEFRDFWSERFGDDFAVDVWAIEFGVLKDSHVETRERNLFE
jgi:hypothetical protein